MKRFKILTYTLTIAIASLFAIGCTDNDTVDYRNPD